MDSSLHYTSVNHADYLIGAINQLRRRTELCDVVLNIGEHRIPVHRLVLSACMPYFHGLLKRHTEDQPAEVYLNDVNAEAAQSIIEFCYTSAISVTEDNVLTLLPTAFTFQLDEISNLCCDFLMSQLRPDSCLNSHQIAVQCACHDLQQESAKFIQANFDMILSEESFLDLPINSLIQTLKGLQDGVLGEAQVLSAIKTWVEHYSEDRQQTAPKIAHNFPDLVGKLKDFLPEDLLSMPLEEMEVSSPGSRPDDAVEESSVTLNGFSNGAGVIICSICGEIFESQLDLDRHKQECDDSVLKPEILDDSPVSLSSLVNSSFSSPNHTDKYYRHVCPICSKSFPEKKNLSKHLKIHSQNGYTCDICHKRYSTKSNLQGHMRIHTGERPFSCEFCGKGFGSYCVLKVHIRTHTGEKPFPCPTCGVSFAKNIHLKRHMQIHTGAKPHLCTICGKHFSRSDHLKRHIQSIHSGAKPHICSLCGKDFVRKYELNKHFKLHFGQSLDGSITIIDSEEGSLNGDRGSPVAYAGSPATFTNSPSTNGGSPNPRDSSPMGNSITSS